MIKLYNYQQELINHIKLALKQKFRAVCIVSPCGSGKSIIQGMIAASATKKKNKVLFLVHRKELLQQIEQTFICCGVDFNYCNIGMVQTVSRRLTNEPEPNIIITDENHHCLANSYVKIYEHFSDSILLGFTATPIRLNQGGLGVVYKKLVKGPTVKWLISNRFLSPFRLYSNRIIDTSKLHIRNGDFKKDEVNELTEQKIVYGKTLKNWTKLAKDKKTIVYCSSIKASKELTKEFSQANISAAHLDAKTSSKDRENTINAFRNNKIKVLCNVDLFGEGFDVPDCECVILLRPTKSLSLYIQQSMRCMRYKENKEAIIIDQVGNCYIHGLPDDNREWSLESKKLKEASTIKECKLCFAVVPTGVKICPYCGNEFLTMVRDSKPMEVKDIILEEIKSENILATKPHSYAEEIKDAKTLLKFQLCKGYKPNWINYQLDKKGYDMEITFDDLVAIQKFHKWKFMYCIKKAEQLNIEIPNKYKILKRYAQ
jgi:superfamily II DNA or RNA helicase